MATSIIKGIDYEEVKSFLSSLKEAMLESKKQKGSIWGSAPLVTTIANEYAQANGSLTILEKSLSLLSLEDAMSTYTLYEELEWCGEYDNTIILQRGILDAFVQTGGCFPNLMTPGARYMALKIIGKILPEGAMYSGPEVQDYIEYAYLVARVIQKDNEKLDQLLEEDKKAKQTAETQDAWSREEVRKFGDENVRRLKMTWFAVGDGLIEAIRFLNDPKVESNKQTVSQDLLRGCFTAYSGGACPKARGLFRVNEKHLSNCLKEALNLKEAAWGSLRKPQFRY